MLTKCSNPSCSASFRHLQDGKLFRIETVPAVRTGNPNRVEYFWLCDRCSSTMTLRLEDNETVVAVPILEPIRDVPDAVISVDRNNGLILRRVRFLLPEELRNRTRTRQNDEHHVA